VVKAMNTGEGDAADVRRRFVHVEGRGVHYLRAGAGPPVVLLHAGMGSADQMSTLLRRLMAEHTVFAFDHPGYGDSDALPETDDVEVDDVADALNATLERLAMPRCPVYGSHTGGAVALELARRHPERVSAVVVDGPCMFRVEEAAFFRGEGYLPPFVVRDDGSHLFAAWIKVRDQAMWFPWNVRTHANRTSYPFGSPEDLHSRLLERLRAGDGYRAVYRAAFIDGGEAVAAVTVPATFVAASNDLLLEHLDRLPPLRSHQRIVRTAPDSHVDALLRVLRDYRGRVEAPPDAAFRPAARAINRRYVDLPGGQVLVRSVGERRCGRPLVLLHDGRASSRVFEPLMRALARDRPVYAPDMPDNGASDPLAAERPAVADYAGAVADTVEALGVEGADVYAVGAGGAVALELLRRRAVARAVVEAPDWYPRGLARRLARDWVPPLAPAWDGSHLTRLWLMLRDEYAFWPWFDTSPAAACAVDAPADWGEFHARVVDVLRRLPTYHRLTMAALEYDWSMPLRRVGEAVTLVSTANDPRRPHAAAAARDAGLAGVAEIPADPDGKAAAILRLLDS
jgi:pimeloyl-ACP methyl ester carboxylesterase